MTVAALLLRVRTLHASALMAATMGRPAAPDATRDALVIALGEVCGDLQRVEAAHAAEVAALREDNDMLARALRRWNERRAALALVCDGTQVAVYEDGDSTPLIARPVKS